MMKINEIVVVKDEILPESEFWDKGYWKIPKGYKTKVLDIDKYGYCLIEYLDATFYIDSKLLCKLETYEKQICNWR